ncbi:MAG: TonB family protein [Candidatus Omnitrophica bacterium]|nr:TonB family protein [Candidatus Omnitrophota bacterium]
MNQSSFKHTGRMAATFFFLALLTLPLSAQERIDADGGIIDMVVGDVEQIAVNALSRVSVTSPEVADISDVKADKISILAKKSGKTLVFLWDQDGKHSMSVRVVNENLEVVKGRIARILEEAHIKGVSIEENMDMGKVVLTGEVSKEDKDLLGDILQPYSESVLNFVKKEKNDELIQIDMQVIEISTTLEQNLGIQWSNMSANSSSSNSSTTTGGTPLSSTNTTAGLNLPYAESKPHTDGSIGDYFKVGNFNRNFQLQATVNALLQEGKAKLISKPRLVVVSGKQASFLVGGEIPIQSQTTNATGSSQTTTTSYTQYGVNMTVTPTIRSGKVDVVLNVDIRDVDNSSAFSTTTNVAFITRNASTDLLMENKQTIALAGLIKYAASETLTEVPFLSKIPVVGALFRNRTIPGNSNTEMVIILTPTVLTNKKFVDNQIVFPTQEQKTSYQKFDAKYEHEALPAWPVVKETKPVPPPPVDMIAMTAYARMVQLKISKEISAYPQANGAMISGTVKLKLCILKDGTLGQAEVIESSGNDTLDQYALQAARNAAPYDAFTSGIVRQNIVFTIPIMYGKTIAAERDLTQRVIASY